MVERLLKSLLASTYKNIEIIVVDDASKDGTYEFIKEKFKKFRKIKIIKNKKNLYTAGSRNVGFRLAKGEFVFFIDDDNVLDKKAISLFVELFLKDSTIAELGPVNYSYLNKKKILWAGTKRDMFTTKTNQYRNLKSFGNSKNWETDDVLNAFIVRANIVRKHKIFFREKYGIMYEESDYAYRIRRAGYKIKVVRGAKIYHDAESLSANGKIKDYMFHFMNDKRRPYVFARNRVLFHSLYSNKYQLVGIILFWIWFFAFYYIYRILSYSGAGKFSLVKRIYLSFQYFKGIINGLCLVFEKKQWY